MGTFITGENSESIFKVFLKQQLLNISADPNKIYKDNNFSRIKGILIDQGQEKILTKLFCTLYLKWVNDDKTENLISGSFFLPFLQNYHIMLAGNFI